MPGELEILAAPTFLNALHRRRKDARLLDAAVECVARLRIDPYSPGLNLEALFTTRDCEVFSVRIDRQYRLILSWAQADQVVLLHFDNHDEAYDWASSSRSRIPQLVQRAALWQGLQPPSTPPPVPAGHPDDPVVLRDAETLREMIDGGLVKYLAHLSPEQQHLTEFDFQERSGLMFIKGGAGTGKTAIAIHRLLHIARRPEMTGGKIQYLCFSRTLAETVYAAVRALSPSDVAKQIYVATFHQWSGYYLGQQGRSVDTHPNYGAWLLATVTRTIREQRLESELGGVRVPQVVDEIVNLIKPWDIANLDEYLSLERVGRQAGLRAGQRKAIWQVFEAIRPEATSVYDLSDIPKFALQALKDDETFEPYRYVVVDEAQDCTPRMADLARRLVAGDDRRLMVLADPAQSIYANGYHIARRAFSPRGAQNVVLRKPYRSTQSIHGIAAQLFKGATKDERETIDLHPPERVGELPTIHVGADLAALEEALLAFLRQTAAGPTGDEAIKGSAVLTASTRTRDHLVRALTDAGIPAIALSNSSTALDANAVKVATIHASKGLEFPNVYVFAPPDLGDDARASRNLLYVAMTRSSEILTVLVSADAAASLLEILTPDSFRLGGAAHLVRAKLPAPTDP